MFDLCEKEDLFFYVKSGFTRYNEKLCRAIFAQILHGLHFMHHKCGMAHLDIKLENIVLDDKFIVKLIDFAYTDNIHEKLRVFRGTENYMAPEVFGCRKSSDLPKRN